MTKFDVEVNPSLPAGLLSTDWSESEASEWCLYNLDVALGYSASVAVKGEIEDISLIMHDFKE